MRWKYDKWPPVIRYEDFGKSLFPLTSHHGAGVFRLFFCTVGYPTIIPTFPYCSFASWHYITGLVRFSIARFYEQRFAANVRSWMQSRDLDLGLGLGLGCVLYFSSWLLCYCLVLVSSGEDNHIRSAEVSWKFEMQQRRFVNSCLLYTSAAIYGFWFVKLLGLS
jgi:hypothetical protein